MDLESGIKWHLQVLPRGMTLIKIIHDPLQNNRLERNTAFSRRHFPGSALPFSHSLWRQIKNSLGSHWCQCLHSCLHRKHLEKSSNWPRLGPHEFSRGLILISNPTFHVAIMVVNAGCLCVFYYIVGALKPLWKARAYGKRQRCLTQGDVTCPAAQQESSWWTVHCRCQMILSATETDKLFSVSVKWDGLLFTLAPCDLICLKPSCFSLEWPRMSRQKEKNSRSQRSIQLFVRNAQGSEVTVERHVTHTSSICQRVFSPADNPKYVAVSNQFGYEHVLDRNQNNWFHLAQAPPFTGLVTPPYLLLSRTHTRTT